VHGEVDDAGAAAGPWGRAEEEVAQGAQEGEGDEGQEDVRLFVVFVVFLAARLVFLFGGEARVLFLVWFGVWVCAV
jgi:hypothetical protein